MMREVDYRSWAKYILSLLKLAGYDTRRSILKTLEACELACGTGNLSFMLHKLGFSVTGVDGSKDMLHMAYSKMKNKPKEKIRFLHSDMVEFAADIPFDLAVCVYDSINYLPTEEMLSGFFKNVHGILKDGGVLVFDASLESNSLGDNGRFTQHGSYRGIGYQRTSQYDPTTKIHTTNLRVKKGTNLFAETHREYVYKLDTIRKSFRDAGFSERLSAGDFGTQEANARSERVHFVLSK